MLYLCKSNLLCRSIFITLQDIQYYPNCCNKLLNPQRKFLSADSTGLLNARPLKVNVSLRIVIYC